MSAKLTFHFDLAAIDYFQKVTGKHCSAVLTIDYDEAMDLYVFAKEMGAFPGQHDAWETLLYKMYLVLEKHIIEEADKE